MFASRFTALLDACVLVSPLKRELLLTLADAAFFRPRWSKDILDEVERNVLHQLEGKNAENASMKARRLRTAMETGFAEALVEDYSAQMGLIAALRDDGDRHVVAAAIRTEADLIVTDNLRDFQIPALERDFDIHVKSADTFLADTIDLNIDRAVVAVQTMRQRWKRPEVTPSALLIKLEKASLTQTFELLAPHEDEL